MNKFTITSVIIFLAVSISGCSSQNHLIYYAPPVPTSSQHFTNPENTTLKSDTVEGVVLFTNNRCAANINFNSLFNFAKGDLDESENSSSNHNSFHLPWAHLTIFF